MDRKLAFALKMLKKFDIVESMQQEHILNERKIQLGCSSPFILKLFRTFRDDNYVYFLMETCLGGDLWHLLYKLRNHRFEDKEAKFYAACVLEAIAFLHSNEIIYRDLKPENLLIAANGYLKLSDFGLAKKLNKGDKTFTFAGTPEYLAPEVVLCKGYTKAVDCWQIGVIIFELLCKRTPFRSLSDNPMDIYEKITRGLDETRFPVFVDLNAQSLIKKLCRLEPTERLGMGENGVEDIRSHNWFAEFDWKKLRELKLKPPFIPKLKGLFDTRYIDKKSENVLFPPPETSGWDDVFQM
ncbi:cGMP-dependent protein kinase 1 [Leptinotarsa decemlineata]|uniref:cGMP-dependent protein kinase 1 n=1 Tax=Leptinotarsa decemlineata TaxID=7539 RepID=UPI003D304678